MGCHMPGGDDFLAAIQIRRREQAQSTEPRVLIIVLSYYVQKVMAKQCLDYWNG
jgi:CheY-like chemotaxis protein